MYMCEWLPWDIIWLLWDMVTMEHDMVAMGLYISLSTVVLNSRIGGKSYGFQKMSCFKNQPCNRLYLKQLAGMHW